MKKILCSFVMYCLSTIVSLQAYEFAVLKPNYPRHTIKVIDSFDHKQRSTISFILDKEKHLYLIKQTLKLGDILYSVREALASAISEKLNMPTHRVALIPVGFDIPGKKIKKDPATIHTIVPGKPISDVAPSKQVDIRQSCSKKQQIGLTREILYYMSKHPVLPIFVAFDTFIGNGGRHKNNLFYDKKTNNYYGIDQEHSFVKQLAILACTCIKKMIEENEYFTLNEQKSIVAYRNTLKKLIAEFSPEKLYAMLDHLIQEAKIDTSNIQVKKMYKDAIARNYAKSKELLILLNQLIQKFSVKEQRPYSPFELFEDNRSLKEIINAYRLAYGNEKIIKLHKKWKHIFCKVM